MSYFDDFARAPIPAAPTRDRRGRPIVHLPRWAAGDPDVARAARVIEKSGAARVVTLAAGLLPDVDAVVILPDELFSDANSYRALQLLGEASGAVMRPAGERVTAGAGDAEHWRSRGFSEAEIEAALKPWIAQGRSQAAAAEVRAREAYQAALADVAASRKLAEAGALTP